MKQITMDCENITTSAQLHMAISQALAFPEYYGKNLDALFDCLTEICDDTELILLNWHKLEYTLKDYSGKLLYVFHCACKENSQLTVTLHP